MKLIDTHQLLAYDDDGNILSGSVHAVKKRAGDLLGDIKETGVEANG